MRGLKGKIVIYITVCLLVIAPLLSEQTHKIAETLDLITALYVALALSFSAGFVAGLTTLHVFLRLRIGGPAGSVIRHA